MGIELWLQREARPSAASAAAEHAAAEPRVRMAAGSGAWLLVQRRPWDGRHAELLADLQALLGAAQCRFGQWADSREAGLALSELSERGVRQVLAFGPLARPVSEAGIGLLELPPLDELATSGAARRSLWQALRPLLRR